MINSLQRCTSTVVLYPNLQVGSNDIRVASNRSKVVNKPFRQFCHSSIHFKYEFNNSVSRMYKSGFTTLVITYIEETNPKTEENLPQFQIEGT